MRPPKFPSRTKKPLLGNNLTGPVLDLVFGIIKTLFVLREQGVRAEYRYNKFYELTYELVLRLYAENVSYAQCIQALSNDTTQAVIDSNPFDINLEAWLDAYPTNKKHGQYSHTDYENTHTLLSKFIRDDSDLSLKEFPNHNYLASCMYIIHSIQKKIEHFCPRTWKKIQKSIPKLDMPFPSKKKQTKDFYTHFVIQANSIFTEGLHANKYSRWSPKKSFQVLHSTLEELGPFMCGPLKNRVRSFNEANIYDAEEIVPDELGEEMLLRPPYPYHILYHASTSIGKASWDGTESTPYERHDTDCVFLINPNQPNRTIILRYADFCQTVCPLPFYPYQGTAYALHLDSEQANQHDYDAGCDSDEDNNSDESNEGFKIQPSR